jgi:hypothetical protein
MNSKTKRFLFITLGLGAFLIYASKIFGNNSSTGKNIVIGDSHAVMIASKLKNATAPTELARSGWNVSSVINALNSYPVSTDVSKVFLSIGTNSGYDKNDNIESLVSKIYAKFPNARLYVFKGSYGWSGRYENANAATDLVPYYQRFSYLNATVLNNGLGYFATDAKAHSTSSTQAQNIINEINNLTK